MKVLLLLCFLATGYAAVIDDCSAGQAHWCTSLRNAKHCGAVQHCIDNVWSQQKPYAADSEDICKFCENIITDVRNLFNNNTEAQVVKYMDAACNVIPVPELADECKDYVKNDLPEVFQLIRSQLNPGAICSTMGLCAAFKDYTKESNSLHRVAILKASQDVGIRVADLMELTSPTTTTVKTTTAKPDLCQDCMKLTTDIRTIVNGDAAKIEQFIKNNVCSRLGLAAKECTDVVDVYLPELQQMIEDRVTPKLVCEVLTFCPRTDRTLLPRMRLAKSPLFKAASQLEGTRECDGCKVLLSELRDLDTNKIVQANLDDLLKEKLCPLLGSLKAECLETVDTYSQFLFEFLANELDPATRCESLGFCSSANLIRRAPMQVAATRQATPTIRKQPVVLKQSVQCVLCEFIVDKLDNILENNSTEAEIIAAVDKVCKILPDTIKEECDNFIKTYGPAIVDLLLQEITPRVLCTTLGLCIVSKDTMVRQPALKVHRNMVVKTTETCGVCEMVIGYVDSLLEENATEAEIEKALDNVCNLLPGNLKPQCDAFIKTYGPQVIQLIIELADPTQVCTELGLCKKSKATKMTKLNSATIIKPKQAHLAGVDKCTIGPAYWCANKDTAKKCNAVSHCERHVWN